MPFHFPHVDEVRLGRPPLKEVICQVRYPTVLRISGERPAAVQEAIAERFPELKVESNVRVDLEAGEGPGRIGTETQTYRFSSADASRTLTLTPDFYALSTSAYRRWTDFADDLEYVQEGILSQYKIAHAKRIGLRYINHIDASFTKSQDPSDICELVKENLVPLVGEGVVTSPKLGYSRYEARLSEESMDNLTFQYGIVPQVPDGSPVFLLDFDAYAVGSIPLDEVTACCARFHQRIYEAFRWCIRGGQLGAFQPQE